MRKRTVFLVVLLILVVVTPILAMVWFGVLIDRQRGSDAASAFAPIESLGGVVWTQAIPFERYSHYVVEFPPDARLSDENVSRLASLNMLPEKNTLDVLLKTPKVTDKSVPQLKELRTADGLDVTQTSISDRGIAELRQALPHATVKERQNESQRSS